MCFHQLEMSALMKMKAAIPMNTNPKRGKNQGAPMSMAIWIQIMPKMIIMRAESILKSLPDMLSKTLGVLIEVVFNKDDLKLRRFL